MLYSIEMSERLSIASIGFALVDEKIRNLQTPLPDSLEAVNPFLASQKDLVYPQK